MDVQAQTLVVQVQLVTATVLLDNSGNLSGVLNLTQLNITLALLDRVTNQLG